MLEKLRSILRPAPKDNFVVVTSAEQSGQLPKGFFQVERPNGKTSLGYNGKTGYTYNAGTTVVDGGERVTLNVAVADLPLVKLSPPPRTGETVVGNQRVIDTDTMGGEFDGQFEYGGNDPYKDKGALQDTAADGCPGLWR